MSIEKQTPKESGTLGTTEFKATVISAYAAYSKTLLRFNFNAITALYNAAKCEFIKVV